VWVNCQYVYCNLCCSVYVCVIVLCVCTGVRLLPPGENPTAVRNNNNNNNNNNNCEGRESIAFLTVLCHAKSKYVNCILCFNLNVLCQFI
jgi:hypothetical protein